MTASLPNDVSAELGKLDSSSPLYATQFVDLLLAAARDTGASDVHLHPQVGRSMASSYDVRWRIDGVLQTLGEFPRGSAADIVARLKVLAGLLTYRTDVPQEGRIRGELAPASIEMRVSTFPTLHGERAVVRLFAGQSQFLYPQDLGLPQEIETALLQLLGETSGAVLITGPAGSGKTTTAYTCVREVVRGGQGGRSVVSLEDPVEMALPGVSQSQVQPAAGFDLATGLRSLMRQDPEVILVGEIRDRPTAETVFQAALTGHLVLSTFHAGSAAGGISRLIDMGIEPYLLRSGVRAMQHQRLVRRLCACASAGCAECRHTGYRGRLVLAELLPPLVAELGEAVLARRDAVELARLAVAAGMIAISQRARSAVEAGATDQAEVRRVLGISDAGAGGAC
jgi:type II secretory ATPase GspE/PulE/Tfp pilus assembly ATPase PilB-like protein